MYSLSSLPVLEKQPSATMKFVAVSISDFMVKFKVQV